MCVCLVSRCWRLPRPPQRLSCHSSEPVYMALRVRSTSTQTHVDPQHPVRIRVCVFLASQTGSSRLTCHLALTCRCSGVSHAWDEQQRSASVKSEWPEPVGQPTAKSRQYGQHRHDAHAPLTEQVPYTNTHTLGTHINVWFCG